MQLSTSVRNAVLDAIETTIGTSPVLRIRTGSAPSAPSDSDSGTVLATVSLPSDWMTAASGGIKDKDGTWSTTASDTGTAGHFRLYASDGVTCHQQGTVGVSSADMIVDSVSFTSGQTFSITQFRWVAPNP